MAAIVSQPDLSYQIAQATALNRQLDELNTKLDELNQLLETINNTYPQEETN